MTNVNDIFVELTIYNAQIYYIKGGVHANVKNHTETTHNPIFFKLCIPKVLLVVPLT